MQEDLYKELSGGIIGCAMRVHNFLGPGFLEISYQRALSIELTRTGIGYRVEVEREVCYQGICIGTRRIDILVENRIVVELKALPRLEESHKCQVLNYLHIFNLNVGLLINFGEQRLRFRRLINSQSS